MTPGSYSFTFWLSLAAGVGAWLLARRGALHAGALFAAFTVSGGCGIFHFFGMETTLHLALILMSVAFSVARHRHLTGLSLGLVCLSRYDGVVVAASVLACRWMADRRLPWREAAIAAGILGSWLGFAWLYFGHPLPNTLAAKSADLTFLDYARQSLEHQHVHLFTPLQRVTLPFNPSIEQLRLLFWPLSLAILLSLIGWLRLRPFSGRSPAVWDLAPLPLAALLLWLGYSWIGPPIGHRWYLTPIGFIFIFFGLLGCAPLFARVPLLARRLATLALLGATAWTFPIASQAEASYLINLSGNLDRIPAYEQFARFIVHHGQQNSTIFSHEPGYMTYLTGQRVIDGAGLVTPNIFFHGPEARRTNYYDLIVARRPEFAVLMSRMLHEPAGFEAHYLPLAFVPPGRALWLQRTEFLRSSAFWLDSWRSLDFYQLAPAQRRKHHSVDFGISAVDGWTTREPVAISPLEHLSDEQGPVTDAVLHSRDSPMGATVWTEPFPIDFDEMAFFFGANHPWALCQLNIDGLLAFEFAGREGQLELLERIEIPVQAWGGRTGQLVFIDADLGPGHFAVDRVEWRHSARRQIFDDFESGQFRQDVWAETFSTGPIDNRSLAERGGLLLAQGVYAASSLERAGTQTLASQNFRVDHDSLSLTVADFGDPRTVVELRVAGQRKHHWQGSGRGLQIVKWDLRSLRGQEAVLIVRDEAPEKEIGLGIDSIVLYDAPSSVASVR